MKNHSITITLPCIEEIKTSPIVKLSALPKCLIAYILFNYTNKETILNFYIAFNKDAKICDVLNNKQKRIISESRKGFTKICELGDLEIAKWMIHTDNHNEIDIHTNDDYAFKYACKKGHLELAKWLISLELTHNKIDIHADDEYAFRWACGSGHLELAKWLVSLELTYNKINIHADGEFAFRYACENGHLELAKWLISLESTHGKINFLMC